MKIAIKFIFPYLLILFFFSCKQAPDIIEVRYQKSLMQADENRPELEKVVQYFANDKQKQKAAKALIAYVEDRIHYTSDWIEQYEAFFPKISQLKIKEMKVFKDSIQQKIGGPRSSDLVTHQDIKSLDAAFLITHIEEAFDAWQNAPWSNQVSFKDFCNFILPYKNDDETPELWRSDLKAYYSWVLEDSFYTSSLF